MGRESETKKIFGDNPVTRMNTFEKLTALKQPERPNNGSRILTTPESIVRGHRRVMMLRTDAMKIKIRQPEPLSWHEKVDWNFVVGVVTCGCVICMVGWAVYEVFRIVIPFITMPR